MGISLVDHDSVSYIVSAAASASDVSNVPATAGPRNQFAQRLMDWNFTAYQCRYTCTEDWVLANRPDHQFKLFPDTSPVVVYQLTDHLMNNCYEAPNFLESEEYDTLLKLKDSSANRMAMLLTGPEYERWYGIKPEQVTSHGHMLGANGMEVAHQLLTRR